jgi:hypothetical protein
MGLLGCQLLPLQPPPLGTPVSFINPFPTVTPAFAHRGVVRQSVSEQDDWLALGEESTVHNNLDYGGGDMRHKTLGRRRKAYFLERMESLSTGRR